MLHSSSSLLDTTLTYNVHSQSPPNSNSYCGNSNSEALYFYQNDSMDFRSFGGESYTITSRQAVTREIDLKALIPLDMPSILCQELLYSLESVNMQKLVATVDNLSSIFRDLGNQTVDLEFSKVLLINDISYLHTHCIIITHSTHVNHTIIIICAHR